MANSITIQSTDDSGNSFEITLKKTGPDTGGRRPPSGAALSDWSSKSRAAAIDFCRFNSHALRQASN
jgi:hypothetical protein